MPTPPEFFSSVYSGYDSDTLLTAPYQKKNKIAKDPFLVLDAPGLQDDFYLNLIDWSNSNVLAVGLGSCIYLWSGATAQVSLLLDLGPDDAVASVQWQPSDTSGADLLAIGTSQGALQIWDTIKVKKIRELGGHSECICTIAWASTLLATGSHDRTILLRDLRSEDSYTVRLTAHR
jgi:cell division cycle 20-like protein 1, cofactor of APC complex